MDSFSVKSFPAIVLFFLENDEGHHSADSEADHNENDDDE